MKIRWLASAFVCTGLMYCGGGSGGGGSGISGSTTIGQLSDAQAGDLCEYLASLQDQRTVTCGDTTVELGIDPAELAAEIADCTAEVSALDTCTATVGQAESCAEANAAQIDGLSDAELCEIFLGEVEPPPAPAACQALDNPTCEEPQ